MAVTLDDVKAALDAQAGLIQTVATLIGTQTQKIADLQAALDAGGDPAKVQALLDEVTADNASLAALVPPPAA